MKHSKTFEYLLIAGWLIGGSALVGMTSYFVSDVAGLGVGLVSFAIVGLVLVRIQKRRESSKGKE